MVLRLVCSPLLLPVQAVVCEQVSQFVWLVGIVVVVVVVYLSSLRPSIDDVLILFFEVCKG